MKTRWIIVPAAALMIVTAVQALSTGPPIRLAQGPQAPPSQALAPEDLVKKSGCLKCHSVDKTVVGPAFKDIAARYKDEPRARAALIETVKKGGKGHWGEISKGVPMPPHQGRLSAADIARLVDWVLSRENK